MKTPKVFALFVLLGCVLPTLAAAPQTMDVTQFGAIADGKTLNTKSLQAVINACSKSGGGTVLIPAGKYLTGTLLLKDNVTLHLNKDATLLGSTQGSDYPPLETFKEGTGKTGGLFLLGSIDAHNVALEGEGTIDGQGASLQQAQANGVRSRPFLIRWVRSDGVTVKGVHLAAAAMWCMHISESKNVTVDGVTILNRGNANNDGIDLDSSDTVIIKNCDIDSRDDALCLKSTSAAPCQNITISACRLKSDCAAIKFGTESVGDFANITITDCHIRETKLGGIKILSVDGSRISNITLADITMDDVTVPIFLRLGSRRKTYHPGDKPRDTGSIQNVTIKNLTITNGKQIAILMSGVPNHPIGPNITLENITVHMTGGGTQDDAKTTLAENEKSYPEIKMFGPRLPASALYARHVDGLTLNDFTLTVDSPDHRPAITLDDTANITQPHNSLPAGEAKNQ